MTTTEARVDALRRLSWLFGVNITRIFERETIGGGGYYVTVDGKTHLVGGLPALMTRARFEDALLVATRGRSNVLVARSEWADARRLIAAAIEHSSDLRSSEARALIGEYLEAHPLTGGRGWDIAAKCREPFVKGGRKYLSLPSLEAFASESWGYEPQVGEVAALLRSVGWEPISVNLPADEDGKRTRIRLWRESEGSLR